MTQQTHEEHTFQAEVQQLLDIVIHSLYTDREIFVRELVSNAADALEKLRHLQMQGETIFDDSLNLEVNITTDEAAGTVTIQDFGVGMTYDELNENLGTIAHSGSKAFLKALQEGQQLGEAGQNLIGQFGVGFYSAFMVADKVEVYTHSWREDGGHWQWTSEGKGSYRIDETEGQRRGAKIVVHLKEDAKEFAKPDRIKDILRRYSSYVQFPVHVNGDHVNTQQAIWTRQPSEVTDEEYNEFYKFQANAFDEPLLRLHFNADAPLAINALLFTPTQNMEQFGFGRMEPGVALYCRKILIDPKPENLLPEWLRFLRGVIDSADLPLNISRETMQDSALVQKLGKLLTNRYLKSLDEVARKDPEKYETFYRTFSLFLKEGVTSDPGSREKLAKLLRYESSLTEKGKLTSFDDYLARMPEGQEEIYYLYGPQRSSIESGPYLEAFAARNREVLFLYEPIDEFVVSHLGAYDGKKLVSADRADLDLGEEPPAEGEPLSTEEAESLCAWLKESLGERVAKVTTGKRLVESPAAALNDDPMMTPGMRKMFQAMQRDVPASPPVHLEINPRHPLVKGLLPLKDQDPALAGEVAAQVLDNALIAAGLLDDPRPTVNRVYDLLQRLVVPGSGPTRPAETPPEDSSEKA